VFHSSGKFAAGVRVSLSGEIPPFFFPTVSQPRGLQLCCDTRDAPHIGLLGPAIAFP